MRKGRSSILVGCISMALAISVAEASNARTFHGSRLNTRIVGGVKAEQKEFPFIVSIRASWGHFCGGSLIHPNWVLTAAHCVKNTVPASSMKIVVGLYNQSNLTGTETFKVKKILIHPEYESKLDNDFDFALIQLSGNSKFQPVEINRDELDISDVEAEAPRAVTAGWGVTEPNGDISDTLMKVEVPLVSGKRCEAAYPKQITDRMICAGFDLGGKDSCQGDSGGPLLVYSEKAAKLVGVVSWGEGCAKPEKFGVYSKVNAAYQWIQTESAL